MRIYLAVLMLLLASPLFAQCDTDQTPYTGAPNFSFDYDGLVEYGYIDGFTVEWQRPGDAGWTEADRIYCQYEPWYEIDGFIVLQWRCSAKDRGIPILRHLPLLPGSEYNIRTRAFAYDHQSGQDYYGGPTNVSGPWCYPEYWVCDRHGCSEVSI
jgi:hypothetical protein